MKDQIADEQLFFKGYESAYALYDALKQISGSLMKSTRSLRRGYRTRTYLLK